MPWLIPTLCACIILEGKHTSVLAAITQISLNGCGKIMKARWFLSVGSRVLLKWEGIDVPLIMHVWKRGSADMSSCSQLPPSPCPHLSLPTAFFLLMPRQRLMTLQSGLGPISPALSHSPLSLSLSRSLSLSLYKWRLSVFIVQRVTRQPADGGLPWPRWTSGASFRNGRSLARWLTATQAGFTTLSLLRYFAACVCFCLSGRFLRIIVRCLSNPRQPELVVACSWRIFFFSQVKCRLLKNVRMENNYSYRWIVCRCWLTAAGVAASSLISIRGCCTVLDVIQITSFTHLYQKSFELTF